MMRMATTADEALIERICNDPSVRAAAADGAPPCVARPYLTPPSFCVVGDEGCFLAKHIESTRYVIHTNLLPSLRGARAVEASREALAIAFLQTDALELDTIVPGNIRHVDLFARQMGFRYQFSRADFWPQGGKLHDAAFFTMTVMDWVFSGACEGAGVEFHQRADGIVNHPPDPWHDMAVGAAVKMARAGRPDKAVAVYNFWARLAGYRQISIASRNPLRIDIHSCVLLVEGDQFFVETPHA